MLLRLNFDPLNESHFNLLKEKRCYSIPIGLLIRCPFKHTIPYNFGIKYVTILT